FHITTIPEHKAVCNGLLDSTQTTVSGTDTSLIHHWTLTDSIPTYLASMAAGPYEVLEHTYHGVARDIPVQLYVFEGTTGSAEGSFQNLDTIIAGFENTYGPYPWQRVGYVAVPFNSGAMEHATNIALGNGFITGDLTYESLIAHELSHSWFGDYITCHDAQEMWINEGWATYSETLYTELLYGIDAAKSYRRSSHRATLLGAHIDDGDFYPLNAVPENVTYGTTSYEKGADVVHSLRAYMADDFFPAVQDLFIEKALDDITSEELRDILSTSSDNDLTEFFNSWVFDKGYPHYKMDSFNVINNGSTYDVEVFIRQQAYGRDNIYDNNRMDICFLRDDFSVVEKRMEFDGEYGSHTFTLDFNPRFVMMDYFERWSDARTSEPKFISSQGYANFSDELFRANVLSVNDSAFMRVSHHWVGPDSFKNPIPGLILADHRYWKVEGDFPNGFEAEGMFSFSNSNSGSMPNLDTDFITNSVDSLVIVHRDDARDDWEVVENQSTSVFLKRITIDSLVPGEYSLAIWDWNAWHSIDDHSTSNCISVYPNPSNDRVNITLDKPQISGHFTIVNSLGRVLRQESISSETNTIYWEAPSPG
ncbi:MAG TPA: M1 family aminopeptidase, partial [Bacteroidales bacterium]|nr:M1 family aminopeptidase [Bacteroidales bacterium]